LTTVLVARPWLLVVDVVAAAFLLGVVPPLAPAPLPAPAVGFALPNIWPSATAL
jgi:hypothetical protein